MKLSIRHIGGSPVTASSIIEMTVESNQSVLMQDVTDLSGFVDEELIQSLRNIADELEIQNDLLTNKKN